MKTIRKRLTYANVISTIALFLVLGGASAIAANHLAKNSVGANQLKKNAVTAAKIKNGAVTGAKINMSTLSTVPSATNASHATSADSATTAKSADSATKADTAAKAELATKAITAENANNAANFSRYQNIGLTTLAVGETKVLFTSGPFTITAKCTEPAAEEYSAVAFLTTSEAGSFATGEGGQSEYQRATFNPGDEVEVGYEALSKTPELSNYGYGGYYSGFTASSADGKTLLSGELTNGVHAYGAACSFFGYALNMG